MRKYYLDNIRWITVVLVVIYHVIYIFNGEQTFGVVGPFRETQYQDIFQNFVYPWFMALLFVVSGISSRMYLENHSDKEFVSSRTVKLLVPSTIGLLVFQWIQGYINMKISGAFETMLNVPTFVKWPIMAVSGTGVLWFIQMLWIFSILLLLIRKVEKDRLYKLGEKCNVIFLLTLTIAAYFFAQILNTPVVTTYRFGMYGFCFYVGYYVFAHDEVIERLEKIWWILDVAALFLGIAYSITTFGENYALEPAINNPLACVYCWIAILAIFATAKKYLDKQSSFTLRMTKKSWGLYIFHYLPLSTVAYFINIYITNKIPAVCYVVTLIAAFAGGYVLYEIISRIPILRWCVLGIRMEKKNV